MNGATYCKDALFLLGFDIHLAQQPAKNGIERNRWMPLLLGIEQGGQVRMERGISKQAMSMEKQRIFLVLLALRWRSICTRLAPTNPDYSMTRIIEPDEKQRIFLVLALRWRRRSSDESG